MMKIDVNKIGKWDEIIKKHWEYVEHNVIPKIDEIEDKDIKQFLNDNLEIIIKGTKNEWDKEIILQYKRLINNTLENHIQAIIQDFMHSRKQKITTILKELEDKGYNSYAEYEDFKIKLREWNKKCQEKEVGKLSFKQDCKWEFLKENFNQEYRTFQMYQKINKAFDYDKFTKGDEVIDWGRYKFLSMLGVDVCPYCNRNYITCYDEKDKKKTTADLDHYYPKSKYPFLALSLYNFVPSCQICNSRFKLDKQVYSLYPYEEGFEGNAKFTTKFCKNKGVWDINYLLGIEGDFELEIAISSSVDSDMKKKIEGSKELFNLESIYSSHKEYVKEILTKVYCYNDERIEELTNEYPELFTSKKEVIEMVFGNYMIDEERMIHRPLSKLTQDILKEFRLDFKENTDKIL